MSLTDIKAKNAKPLEKEYKLTDGFGMFLRVTPKGSKYWQMAYRFEGNKNSSLLVFTLQFLFLTQDNAVTRPEGFWLRVLTLMQRNRQRLKSLKPNVIIHAPSEQ
jgi:hypothetical protein